MIVAKSPALYGQAAVDDCTELAVSGADPVDMCPDQIAMLGKVNSPPPPWVPPLTSVAVDAWSSNLPWPAVPDMAPYVDGLGEPQTRQVLVAWNPHFVPDSEGNVDWWTALLAAGRPERSELVPVPIGVVRNFIRTIDANDKGTQHVDAWVEIGADRRIVAGSTSLSSSAAIVVFPLSAGGGDMWGWTGVRSDAEPGICAAFKNVEVAGWEPGATGTRVLLPAPVTGLSGVFDDGADGCPAVSVTATASAVDGEGTDNLSFGRTIGLAGHHRHVGELAERLAVACGLDPGGVVAVRDAAEVHDAGKHDPRFQRYMNPGWVEGDEILAKTVGGWPGAAENRLRRSNAGLSPAWRHEAHSVQRVGTDGLTGWLIASHHGHGRPIWPAVPDDDTVALQGAFSDMWVDRFEALRVEHGPWGLAFLEALVRAADWHDSAHNQGELQ